MIGAGSAIGKAVLDTWAGRGDIARCWAVSRGGDDGDTQRVSTRATDHSGSSLRAICDEIAAAGDELGRVVIALGTLHGDGYGPEKSLRQLDPAAMAEVYRVNCILPLQWLAALSPLLRKSSDCRVLVLSARVGSIGDNGLGGWYSYRSAKAALNMGLKSAAVELARQARGVKLIAYHPGTVDSPLSEPFQARVPADRLFPPGRAAEHLVTVMEAQRADGELAYLDWAGKSIPW
jgi:NAD(P)-dependent dehydrogenase (short-subunit alcohol dehydrogenase family)